tara:strand:+ start:133 stop:357 length:225 start_codon:yes stop_codon:yes gene_type:complete
MWRIVEEINNITGKSVWVIEKKRGLFFKKWSRDYRIGKSRMPSPIKSHLKSDALVRMGILNSGKVIDIGEVIEI